jgi:hypothetical protein
MTNRVSKNSSGGPSFLSVVTEEKPEFVMDKRDSSAKGYPDLDKNE